MSAIPASSDFRVFGFDCGVSNMGMASIVVTSALDGEARTVCEKLDWRPLIRRGGRVDAGSIVDAVGRYIGTIMTPASPSPSPSPSRYGAMTPDSCSPPESEKHPAILPTASPRPKTLFPNLIVIEQQYITHHDGTNIHAVEIQIALMSRFAERLPGVPVRIVGASARRSGASRSGNQKARASMIGHAFAALDSEYWNTYLQLLTDSQHTCDAITMVLDEIKFANLGYLRQQVIIWEDRQALAEAQRKEWNKAAQPAEDSVTRGFTSATRGDDSPCVASSVAGEFEMTPASQCGAISTDTFSDAVPTPGHPASFSAGVPTPSKRSTGRSSGRAGRSGRKRRG